MGVVTYHVYCRLIGNTIGLILHSVNSLVIFLAMQGDVLKDPDIATLKATQFKFITIWNVAFQLIFMSMNLVCDIAMILKIKENNKYLEHLRSYKKMFFAGVVWPLTLTIFSIFWPIFIYDRELIFPVFIDKVISLPSNHIMHTAIIIIALWEIFFQPRSKPSVVSHIWNLAHVVVIYVTYLIVVLAYHAESGIWPYPMMKMICGTIYFPLFFVVIAILYLICYFVQWPLSNLVFNTCIKSEKVGY